MKRAPLLALACLLFECDRAPLRIAAPSSESPVAAAGAPATSSAGGAGVPHGTAGLGGASGDSNGGLGGRLTVGGAASGSAGAPQAGASGASSIGGAAGSASEEDSWHRCRGGDRCPTSVQGYPSYFFNHPKCSALVTCEDATELCSSDCPPPTPDDAKPLPNTVFGTPYVGAQMCWGSGLVACTSRLTAYPLYFLRHPACSPSSEGCKGEVPPSWCHAACPNPTSKDQAL
jgi:hypothetical protein